MKKTVLAVLACIFYLTIVSCGKNDDTPVTDSRYPAQVGSIAPDFTLRDVSGKMSSLSSYRGNVILLEFWAVWCPPCKAAVPDLIALQDKYHDRGFTVIGVSVDDVGDVTTKVAQFSSAHNINYPVFIADDSVSRLYNVINIPLSFLISKDGTIIQSYAGYSYDFHQSVSAQIEKLL